MSAPHENPGLPDTQAHLAMQVRLKHSKEVVCLAMTNSLVAVGSQSHISLIDPRKKAPVREVESLDDSHGEHRCPADLSLRRHRCGMQLFCAVGLNRMVSDTCRR